LLKELKKSLLTAFAFQTLLVSFLVFVHFSQVWVMSEIQTKTITVEYIKYSTGGRYRASYCKIRSNGTYYEFTGGGDYSAKEFYEDIDVGDTISITFGKKRPLSFYVEIISASKGDKTYLTISEYNARVATSDAITGGIFSFFWFVSVVYVALIIHSNRKVISREMRRRKRARSKRKLLREQGKIKPK